DPVQRPTTKDQRPSTSSSSSSIPSSRTKAPSVSRTGRAHDQLTSPERAYRAAYQEMVCSPSRDYSRLNTILSALHDEAPRSAQLANFRGCLLAEQLHQLRQLEDQAHARKAAIEWLRYAVMLEPSFATAHLNLGAVLVEAGEHDDATTHLERC